MRRWRRAGSSHVPHTGLMTREHTIDLVRHQVSPALSGLVAGMVGLTERSDGVVRRRQPAGSLSPLVFSFGGRLTIDSLAGGAGDGREYGSFLAGLSTGAADTRFDDGQDCLQVYLTPIGLRRILGVPGREVSCRVVETDDLHPSLNGRLADRLYEASTWEQRFHLIEGLLLRGLARTAPLPSWVPWVWSEIEQSGGRARISELVMATGWSHRHVASVFSREVGLTPKQVAGIVRFERAAKDLGRMPLAEVAVRHGYADQSHFARDVARYANETPSQLAAARRPTAATALGN